MKKIMVAMTIFAFLVSLSSFAFAKQQKKSQPATKTVRGVVISADAVKSEIVVKDNKTGQDKTFIADPKVISTLALNEEVKVKFKEGSSNAESVIKIVNPKTNKK